MSAIIKLATPADICLQPAEEKSRFKNPETQPGQKPETRLWKLSAQAVCPNFTLIESSVLLLLLVIGLAAIGSCFVELSHLLQCLQIMDHGIPNRAT
jgi:hypothetical protein